MHSGLDHWSLLLLFLPLGCSLGVSLSHSVEGGVELVKVLRNSSHECFDLSAILLDSSHLSVSVEANVSCFLNDCLEVVKKLSKDSFDVFGVRPDCYNLAMKNLMMIFDQSVEQG